MGLAFGKGVINVNIVEELVIGVVTAATAGKRASAKANLRWIERATKRRDKLTVEKRIVARVAGRGPARTWISKEWKPERIEAADEKNDGAKRCKESKHVVYERGCYGRAPDLRRDNVRGMRQARAAHFCASTMQSVFEARGPDRLSMHQARKALSAI